MYIRVCMYLVSIYNTYGYILYSWTSHTTNQLLVNILARVVL